jgi:aerotaxis receptor
VASSTYANEAFIRASGYGAVELIGQPHNVMRHPDMPQEAFADIWSTVKQGRPWTGFVKNRCKSGDHYWVLADVSPIREGSRITGYMSIRSKPDPQARAEAEAQYRDMKEGRVRAQSLAERISGMSVRTRFQATLVAQAAGILACAVAGRLLHQPALYAVAGLWVIYAWHMHRTLLGMLRSFTPFREALESCDLRMQLPEKGPEEVRFAAKAFNVVNNRFRRVIKDLARVSGLMVQQSVTMRSAAEQLTRTSEHVAEMTRTQEGSMERMASGAMELAASVQEVAQNRGRQGRPAGQGLRRGGGGGAQARRAVSASTKEITQLIDQCNATVDEGIALVGVTVDGGKESHQLVDKLPSMSLDIEHATAEQSKVSRELADQVEASSLASHQQAAAATQMAGASQEIVRTALEVQTIAQRLADTVNQFQV